MNLLSYSILHKSILNMLSIDGFYILWFFSSSIACGYLIHIVTTWMLSYKSIALYRKTTLMTGLLFINLFVYFGWLLGESGRQSFELFIYNLFAPMNTSTAHFNTQIFGLIFFMLLMTICFIIILYRSPLVTSQAFKKRKQMSRKRRTIAALLPSIFILISIYFPIYAFHLEDAYAYLYAEDSFIEQHYIDPNTVSLTWPKQKRNLLYIFVESFESSYFSKELGGMSEYNLLPNLTKFAQEGTYFSNHDTYFGGAIPMPQTNVSIAGITTSLSGVNYKIPADLENNAEIAVVPHITTLLDLLQEQGYQSYFTVGMNVEGYHIGPFFKAHGNAFAQGVHEKIASGHLPVGYGVWWGFEDSKLYRFAREDLQELAKQSDPFIYTMLTNNTHRQEGYTDPLCEYSYRYPMENAIGCTDEQLSEFLRWVKEQPFYEHTTVVVVGDHLGHEEEYVNTLTPKSDRRVFNLILNPMSPEDKGSYHNREFWAGDLFPTVLSSLGVNIEGNRLGLGSNLFSDVPTLIEKFDQDYVFQALSKNSPFYTDTFLQPNK